MRLHFIAVGGTIMHNLAISMAKQGHQVTGSDDQILEPSRTQLSDAGLLPEELGWFPEKINESIDIVILGKHADSDNPELVKAKKLGIKTYSFPELVFEQSLDKTRIVIAGTYGKTTIMSMIMHVLKEQNIVFDYLVGAQLKGFDSKVKLSRDSKYLLIEGDEAYASSINRQAKFEIYKPHIALISGVEWNDKQNQVQENEYYQRFENLILSIEPRGTLIYNKENERLNEIVDRTKDHTINRHGYKLPKYRIKDGVTYLQNAESWVPLKVISKNNLSNIAGAFTVCEWLGITKEQFYESIQSFETSIRYLEFVDSNDHSVVYQDFAHTPRKVRQSIHSVKEQFPDKQLLTVIEFNGTEVEKKEFLQQYGESFNESDYVLVYVDQENPDETKASVSQKTAEGNVFSVLGHSRLTVFCEEKELREYLSEFASQNINLLLMSSSKFSEFNMSDLAEVFLKNN